MSRDVERPAWEEILARIMAGFRVQNNSAPDWLVNPATKRRLKLSKLYPEIDFAVHFVGLQARGQRRRSDEEILAEAAREDIRRSLCRQHSVVLFSLQLYDPDRAGTVDRLLLALSQVSRQWRRRTLPQTEKVAILSHLADARDRASALRQPVSNERGMIALAAAWQDRQLNAIRAAQQPLATSREEAGMLSLQPGMEVEHRHFGRGVVTSVDGDGKKRSVSVYFSPEIGERMFLLSLVTDKLHPV